MIFGAEEKMKRRFETILHYSYKSQIILKCKHRTVSISICDENDCDAKEKVLTSLNNLIESSPPQDKIKFDSCDLGI